MPNPQPEKGSLMPETNQQPSSRLALPSAMGTATVLFHFLFCMLLSSVLLSNPLTGGGFYLVARAAVLYGRWLHPLRFHTLNQSQKRTSIILLSVTFVFTMLLSKRLTDSDAFMANPSRIRDKEVLFAHCTIPFNLIERYELLTHYESGIGVGIRGFMSPGPVTIFKVSGDLQRYFIAEGTLTENLQQPDLCRTQQLIRLDEAAQAEYFLSNPIGNHHIIVPGHHRELLELFMQ